MSARDYVDLRLQELVIHDWDINAAKDATASLDLREPGLAAGGPNLAGGDYSTWREIGGPGYLSILRNRISLRLPRPYR